MDWKNILKNRETVYNWTDEVPPKELIDQILQELHDHCPSKQRKVPFFIDVIDNTDPNVCPLAHDFLLRNKEFIQAQVAGWIEHQVANKISPFENYVYDQSKCVRDVGYIVDSFLLDLRYDTNEYTLKLSSTYWKDGVSVVRRFAEAAAHTYMKTLIVDYIFKNQEATKYQERFDQHISTTAVEAESDVYVMNLINMLIDMVQTGVNSYTVTPGVKRTRFKMFEGADRKNEGMIDDIRNPQVLAPWVLAFSYRVLNEEEIGLNVDLNNTPYFKQIMWQEVGIASTFIMLSAIDKGLSTAFCGCINNPKEMTNLLGHDSDNELILYMGLGYKKPGDTFYNPILHGQTHIPDSDFDTKPPMSKYIKYHIEKTV